MTYVFKLFTIIQFKLAAYWISFKIKYLYEFFIIENNTLIKHIFKLLFFKYYIFTVLTINILNMK